MRRERGRIHAVDVVALVLAAGLAALAYAYLFRHSPVPRPVDPLLGATIDVEFRPTRDWHAAFPKDGSSVFLDEYLECDVTNAETRDGVRVVHLRVRGREAQKPEALTLFRSGVRRGSTLTLSDPDSEVRVEVVGVELLSEMK